MTRILYWNIGNFSLPKIYDPATWITSSAASSRQSHIVEVMRGPVGGPIPDIIVVVEVYSRVREIGAEGIVLNPGSDAAQAVLRLLARIRADATLGAAGTNWCVVPLLNLGELGQREAVAVFYNAGTVQFTGPNLFYQLYGPPGTVVGQSQPVNQATFAAMIPYPAPWLGAMPALGRTTAFPAINQSIAENQLAGEWQYYAANTNRPVPSPLPPAMPPNRLQFPNAGCRGPFYTRFLDVGGNRTINLFSVHSSPATGRGAVQQLANVPQISAVNAGEVNVLLGDFNVDTFSPAADAYTNLLAGSGGIYTMELDSRVAHAGNVVPARKPYCMTHLLPADQGTPYNNTNGAPTDPQHNVYPRAGYMGGSFRGINDTGAIDNILTAYGGAGAAANITVVNTLTGTPYNQFNPPQGVTAELTGGLNFPSTMGMKMLTAIPPATQGVGGVQPGSSGAAFYASLFQLWDYLGRRFSTSDHLPLMIDV
ncbi:hypothetical protein [Nonomuraea sediminis]|uniref:hypothetical protein n=1 Tax=Nonomuraea sediminis TaxID=2835864 RepID=UPI001BDC9781|nr:hypothetical protein [Nonomuraea sediminis]